MLYRAVTRHKTTRVRKECSRCVSLVLFQLLPRFSNICQSTGFLVFSSPLPLLRLEGEKKEINTRHLSTVNTSRDVAARLRKDAGGGGELSQPCCFYPNLVIKEDEEMFPSLAPKTSRSLADTYNHTNTQRLGGACQSSLNYQPLIGNNVTPPLAEPVKS